MGEFSERKSYPLLVQVFRVLERIAMTTDTDTLVEKFNDLVMDQSETRYRWPFIDDGKMMMTDGRILLAFPVAEPPAGLDCIVRVDGKWKLRDDQGRPPDARGLLRRFTEFASVECPHVEGPNSEWNARWELRQDCDKCCGLGDLECDLGHTHDCDECDGNGSLMMPVPEAFEHVEILGETFARRYVWLIGQLPGIKLCPTIVNNMLGFTFDGGRGCLMTMAVDK